MLQPPGDMEQAIVDTKEVIPIEGLARALGMDARALAASAVE